MKNLIVVLGVLILLGAIIFVLAPRPPSTSVINVADTTQPPVNQEQSDSSIDADSAATIPQGTEGTDAGMEFPIPDESTVSQNFAYDMLVTYTANGFVPEEITVARGATVRFENQSDQPMWVGADNHPTHTLYPVKRASDCLGSSFDQCEATEKGTFWDFTFTEAGSFGYHNHRRARDNGTIIVQ